MVKKLNFFVYYFKEAFSSRFHGLKCRDIMPPSICPCFIHFRSWNSEKSVKNYTCINFDLTKLRPNGDGDKADPIQILIFVHLISGVTIC